jgi:hypothetical protein
LDEVLQESAKNGWPISKSDLSKVDDNIVTTFHNNDALKTTMEKKKTKHQNNSTTKIDGGASSKANAHYVTTRSLSGTHLRSYQKFNFLVP